MECPRCRMAATQVAARRGRCTHCDAELVPARSPSEELIRAYLYGEARDRFHVHRSTRTDLVAR